MMTPPDTCASSRGRRRFHHACHACRRKKTRCPGEKPACSSCSRLGQACSYPAMRRPSHGERSEERLAHLEEKLNLLISGSLANRASRPEPSFDDGLGSSEKSYSVTPPAPAPAAASTSVSAPLEPEIGTPTVGFGADDPVARQNVCDMATSIELYFKYCHRQPIWCFEREDVGDYGAIPGDLACSIQVLTCRFSEKQKQMQQQLYRDKARSLVMSRILNGSVELVTVESLCLLSYSYFIDGSFQLGQFHLGVALQLCRTAGLDLESAYAAGEGQVERKRRVFWSLQLLEQYYGRTDGLLRVPTDTWRPTSLSTDGDQAELGRQRPSLPRDELGCSDRDEQGIWNTSVHLGWVWSQVRKYVSDCAQNILREPWRRDSTYAKVLSDFMETEHRIPMCHRYDSAKFYQRKVEELRINRSYWAPWLKEQVTYHAINTVLHHPFLYIIGAQHNPNLAIPNTFWRRSSELALLHSTWIVRLIDMIMDRQVPLTDPFFAHAAAIAATVHLYYCCAAAPKLKHKSNADFAKCKRFLKRFVHFSNACRTLDRTLDRMIQLAAGPAGPESEHVEDWMPSKIYLSVPLMWEILQFKCSGDSERTTTGLLGPSLTPAVDDDGGGESCMLEISGTTSPEITINTADGGQEAPVSTLSYRTSDKPCARDSPWSADWEEANLTLHFTPWLYANSAHLMSMEDMETDGAHIVMGDGVAWWEDDNLSNFMLHDL
ncbi:hypothetical protein RJ55_04888 [Drechmeria coniospora]|nr:hypothetical protein RJ55_04888 [Drechmeria coniospora]